MDTDTQDSSLNVTFVSAYEKTIHIANQNRMTNAKRVQRFNEGNRKLESKSYEGR